MHKVSSAVLLAAALVGCVPVRQSYYEAVGGKVVSQETLATCPPTYFEFGKFPAPKLSIGTLNRDGKVLIAIGVDTGRSTTIDFDPRYVTVESIEHRNIKVDIPMRFYVGGVGDRDLPIHVENPDKVTYLYFREPLPVEMLNGFTLHVPQLKSDTSEAEAQNVTFEHVSKLVASGTFGCGVGL